MTNEEIIKQYIVNINAETMTQKQIEEAWAPSLSSLFSTVISSGGDAWLKELYSLLQNRYFEDLRMAIDYTNN